MGHIPYEGEGSASLSLKNIDLFQTNYKKYLACPEKPFFDENPFSVLSPLTTLLFMIATLV